jgi:transposase
VRLLDPAVATWAGRCFDRTVGIRGRLEAILKHRPMADDYRRIELITGEARRRQPTTEQKLQIIEERFRRARRCRLLPGAVASRQICSIVDVVCWRTVERLQWGPTSPWLGACKCDGSRRRVLDLGRLLGKKTMEVEILKDALAKSESKKRACGSVAVRDGSR